ncbi:F-type H+-transporting ATPase subunit delta [Allocatelliglobosispora scoriae]|uniref:ATP synthase subunit delta n=1 Tax=Allocatelliglobosispora scoriae TaxID=643052 RepID=A0A841BZF5_9ACTN|nr:F0F1 ATP synthase subunit delta [Allocatelliglobosispora scoriae]MBB5872041.1 F-type H+-transporting ATPase subunit delta [Allocatelliglobosispora scoriae]
MQAASRESYAAALAALNAYAGRSDATAVAGTAKEILSVASVLAGEPRLRRALIDPSRTGDDRGELLGSVLGGKIGTDAVDLLKALVAGRWSSPTELLTAIEQLGVDGLLASAEASGDLAEVEDELFRFGQVVSGTPQLAATIGDSTLAVDRRVALATELLEGKAKPATVTLAQQSVRGFGGRSFASALSKLVEAAAERRERDVAYVTVAEPLSEAEEQRLGASLAQRYGREVSVKVTVDPDVLGGVRVLIGSDLYDGTVARRLADVRASLA